MISNVWKIRFLTIKLKKAINISRNVCIVKSNCNKGAFTIAQAIVFYLNTYYSIIMLMLIAYQVNGNT